MIRHIDSQDPKTRMRMRPSVAPASPAWVPDLQALLATGYLLEKIHRPLSREADPSALAELFASLVSLQRQAADLDESMDQVLASVAQKARTLTRADAAAVAMLEGESVLCRARDGAMAPRVGTPINLQASFTGQSFQTQQALYCRDTEEDARVNRQACRAAGIGSILVIPVVLQRQSIGIVVVFSAAPARFGAGQIHALELMAGFVSDAVRTRELAETQRRPDPPAPAPEIVPTVAAPLAAVETEPQPKESEVAGEPAKIMSPDPAATSVEQAPPMPVSSAPRRPGKQIAFGALLLFGTIFVSSSTGIFPSRVATQVPAQPPALAPSDDSPPTSVPIQAPTQMVTLGPGVLLGVKHNSRPEFTSIAIELSAPVKVKAERLNNPERIYFDLADTHIAPDFMATMHMKAIAIDDRLVNRVRVAQTSEDVARVVIDLNRACEFTYVMSEAPPFRLVVELHAPDTAVRSAAAMPAPPVTPPGSVPSRNAAEPVRPWKIVIDPGHGGWDRGSVGPTGLLEKEVVLDVSERLSKLLKARLGADVMLTRTDDSFVPLEARPALANSVSADLFLSIHGNSSSLKNIRGVETYYVTPAAYRGSAPGGAEVAVTESRHLAAAVQHALHAALAGADPLVQDRGVKAAALSVLEAPVMPSVLTEISFVTSPHEEQELRRPEYRDTIAEALFQGVKTYLSRDKQPHIRTAALQGK